MSNEPRAAEPNPDSATWRLAQQTRLLAGQIAESGAGERAREVIGAAEQLVVRLAEHEHLATGAAATARALERRAEQAYAATDELRGHHDGAERAARTAFTEVAGAAGVDARAEHVSVELLDALQAARDELSGADVARVGDTGSTAPPPPDVHRAR